MNGFYTELAHLPFVACCWVPVGTSGPIYIDSCELSCTASSRDM